MTNSRPITKAAALEYVSALSAEIRKEQEQKRERPQTRPDRAKDGRRLIAVA